MHQQTDDRNTFAPPTEIGPQRGTLANRIQRAGPPGGRVRIISAGAKRLRGRYGVLDRIDRDDASSTFRVGPLEGTGGHHWVYAVEPAPKAPQDALLTNPELDAFKAAVAAKARALAEEHGWCDVIEDALTELGIEPPLPARRRITGTITVKYPFSGEILLDDDGHDEMRVHGALRMHQPTMGDNRLIQNWAIGARFVTVDCDE